MAWLTPLFDDTMAPNAAEPVNEREISLDLRETRLQRI